MTMIRIPATLLGLTAVLGSLLMALAAPALAHDELLRSSPGDAATVSHLPRTITLYFEEPPAPGFTTMSVSGPDGRKLNTTGPSVAGSQVSEHVRSAAVSGACTITYRIMSDDGHAVSGTIHFAVGASAPMGNATVKKTSAASAPGPAASMTTLLYAVAAAAVIAVVLGLASRSRRARDDASGDGGAGDVGVEREEQRVDAIGVDVDAREAGRVDQARQVAFAGTALEHPRPRPAHDPL
jgi:methionine-rich copper-binding protein CopC